MKNSKLITLLSALSYKESKSLRKFVDSPYFNSQPLLLALLDALLSPPPGSHLQKSEVWDLLFPDADFDDLKLRHLMSDLLRLTCEFLTLEALQQQKSLTDVFLLRSLRAKDLPQVYEFTLRKQGRKSNHPPLGSDAFLHSYLLQEEHNTWLRYTANRSGITKLQETVDHLDLFYLFNKLKYSCTILNNRRIMDIPFENVLLEEILLHLERRPYDEQPGIAVYFQIYKMLTASDPGMHYHRLKRLLLSHSKDFEQREARDMYLFAMNFCIGQINKGDNSYLSESFALYRTVLERQLIFEKGRLTPWDFKNIVVVGLRLAEFGWVEDFIRKYRGFIAEEHRENAYTYNLAKLHFYRKEYGEVLKLLQKVEYEDVFYNMDSKVMLLKIYYESGEIEALDSLIDSFRIFLRRNKLISDHHRTNYLNLIRFVRKLSRLRPGDGKRMAQLLSEIDEATSLADAHWLRTKVEELV